MKSTHFFVGGDKAFLSKRNCYTSESGKYGTGFGSDGPDDFEPL